MGMLKSRNQIFALSSIAPDAAGLSRRGFLFAGTAFGLTACASQNNLIGVPPKRALTEDEIAARGHRIFIATLRRPSDAPGEFFSGRRAYKLSFAAVDVVIPPTHKIGKIERPRSLPPDPDRHFIITNPQVFQDEPSVRRVIDADILKLPRGKRSALLWVHGYNTNLTSAVLRLAQFVEDTGYTGIPILYSWASKAQLGGYVYDMNSALMARDNLEQIPRILQASPLESLDIVAHSMGNLVAMEAARGVANRGIFNRTGKLRTVVLASPDIDIDLFIFQLSSIPPENLKYFFVLTSADDQALSVSRSIARNPRVGQLSARDLSNLGLNVIDLTQVSDPSSINHSKFADAPEVVQLIGERLLAGDSAQQTRGVEAIVVGAGGTIRAIDEAIRN